MSLTSQELYRKLAKAGIMLGMASLVAVSIGIAAPQPAQAGDDDPYVGTMYAPYNTVYICGRPIFGAYGGSPYTGSISQYDWARECHYYDLLKARIMDARGTIQMMLARALSEAAFNFAIMMGQQMAEWVFNGFHGEPAFWRRGFGGFLKDVGMEFTNRFIDTLDKQWGLGLCQPVNLGMKLSLAIGEIKPLPAPNCTFEKVKNNFENVYRQLEPQELVQTLARNTTVGGNDFDYNLRVRSMYLVERSREERAAQLERVETGGMKPVTLGPFSKTIKTPAAIVDDTVGVNNPALLQKEVTFAQANTLALQAMWANLQQLPVVAGMAFLTTLARLSLQKLVDWLINPDSADDTDMSFIDLEDPFAQKGAEPKGAGARARAYTDIIAPNLMSADQIDVVTEMAACTDPRGFWSCTMDEAMASAIKVTGENGGNTVQRAAGLVPGSTAYLHLDWELIPVTEAKDDQDPGCYQRAYCASNLAKMRFARIIPMGWELAANSPFNLKNNGKFVTLGQVLRGFNDCNKDNKLDAEHPWCHLIDPSWVLTSPPLKCQLKGYGDSLFVPEMGMRQQECSDLVSCLSRNDKGECSGGYGYCLAEKTVWRFGADACDEKFVSCRTYQSRPEGPRQGEQVSFVRNTVDYGACNTDNVGCMFYATLHDVSTTTTGKWVTKATYDGKTVDLKTTPRVYFDSKVQACDASNEGCTQVLRIEQDRPALNLVRNGSFENVLTSQTGKLDGWTTDNAGTAPADAKYYKSPTEDYFYSDTGSWSLEFGAASKVRQTVAVRPVRNYVLSFSARATEGAGPHQASVTAVLLKANGQTVASGQQFYRSPNCNATHVGGGEATALTGANVGNSAVGAEWTRYSCEFVSNNDAAAARIIAAGQNVAIDSVQLEEGDKPLEFVDGANSSLKKEYLKLPPEEYACSGDEKTDRKECASFARMCRQVDAGCQGYTEVGGGDQTEIPAILSANDLCPKTCVGYADYRKLASAFDLVKTGSANPADPLDDPADETVATFVPKGARACSAAEAGCEEFTNVEAASAGGEQVLYLTYARACQKPSDEWSRTYFTWEGSDTTGYQLKTWSLIRSDQQTVVPGDANLHYAPKALIKMGPDGVLKDPANCTAVAWKTGEDTDCRQFYDELGYAFYAYYSQTVVSSAGCWDYRKSNSNSADCTKTGGRYRDATNDCIYSLLPAESAMCVQASAGCRGYMGTTGRNTANVFSERFSSATSSSFYAVSGQGTQLTISPEALLVGDNSLKIQHAQGNGLAKFDFPSTTNTLYTVSFWLKSLSASPKTVKIKLGADEVGSFQTSLDWKRFELGPFRAKGGPVQTLTFEGLPTPTYLDEVVVTRQQDVVYVVKDSWTIPAECDQTAEGIPQPQAMLGCREYRDRNGKVADVRQFSRLCRYNAIGCAAYVDTRDSDSAYADVFGLAGLDAAKVASKPWDKYYAGTVNVVRPADRYVYAIDEPSAHCDASGASCRSFGKPVIDWTGAPSSTFETVYLKDDITKYADQGNEPDMLCRPSELFCEKFVSGPVTSYFRDPGEHVCEWKDKVMVEASATYPKGEYSGWFVKGKEPATPCYPDKQSGGNRFLTEFTSAPNYRGWVNECPSDQSECTEFRDPNDRSDQAHPSGKPYFFIANDALDKKSCNGKVDPLGGCVLFRDMNNSATPFSSAATYAKSHKEGDVPVGTINCETDPGNEYCKAAGLCTDQVVVHCAKNPDGTTGYDCRTDSAVVAWLNQTKNNICASDAECSNDTTTDPFDGFLARGRCQKNDANLILKVKLDRDCQTWLGCSSSETVYDPSQQKYVELCTNLAVCDQAGGAASKSFCSHYVDRQWKSAADSSRPLLQGRFLDISSYIQRPTGLGNPDYSGYSIPNHFQTSDLTMRRVAYEMLAKRPGPQRDKLYTDFRLVAAVPYVAPNATSDNPFAAKAYTDNAFPYLILCRHAQSGLVGYVSPDQKSCYLPIEKPYTTVLNEALGEYLGLPGNAQKASVAFESGTDLKGDAGLNRHYPPVECRAHPESNSPFGNSFVKEWNLASDPPVPLSFLEGYDKMFYCEYGEDCDCSYRKVEYQGKLKYYSAFAGTAPAGVCAGGQDDGKACDPGAVADAAKQEGEASQAAAASALADAVKQQSNQQQTASVNKSSISLPPQCRGGQCVPYDKDTYVRGVVGQCLQRDYSRKLGGALDRNPCLIWNPAPVLAGQQDRYHYEPQAGYLPPASAGEYYCLSKTRVPRTNRSQANHQDVQFVFDTPMNTDGTIKDLPLAANNQKLNLVKTPPGKITRFAYHECYVMDTNVVRDTAMPWGYDTFMISGPTNDWYERLCGYGATLDGVRSNGSDTSNACASVRMAYGGGDLPGDIRAGRWITTGRGLNRNYAEYFVEFNDLGWAQWLNNSNTITKADDPKVAKAALEQNFTSFVFKPWYKTGVGGTWTCGMSGWWVDEYRVESSGNGWNQAANTMIQKIMAEFKPLSPENYGFLKNEAGTKLMRLPCRYPENGDSSEGDPMCYYKYWETGFHADGQKKFRTFFDSMGGPRKLEPADVTYAESEGDRPFFAIRAMFEDASPEDNRVNETNMDPSGTQLGGPFRFVGWWITVSFPGATGERLIYMTLDVNHADICKQVARTSSPTTHETAAFTDRIWDGGAFSIPKLGFNYSTEGAPYGSAKHTKAIGKDPLYQLGPMNEGPTFKMATLRPTFIASGASYARTSAMPLGNWAYLNNIFAKIFNVYNYHDMPVGKNSWACVAGPNFGARCPDLKVLVDDATSLTFREGNTEITYLKQGTTPSKWNEYVNKMKTSISSKFCGYSGTCNPELFDIINEKDAAFCNALSGVNAGLTCSGSNTLTGYHICHAAPVKNDGGIFSPQYKACDIASGWIKNEGENDLYSYNGDPAKLLQVCKDELKGTNIDCTKQNWFKNLTRKTAAKIGAFQCASGAVRFPDGTSAWCRQPSAGKPSLDCPLEVGWHLDQAAEGYSTCDTNKHRCTNGYEHTYCSEPYDCTFWWQTWWYTDMNKNGGQPTSPMPYPASHSLFSKIDDMVHPGWFMWVNDSNGKINANHPISGQLMGGDTWWMSGSKANNPAWLGTDGQAVDKDIGNITLSNTSRYLQIRWDTWPSLRPAVQRFPGAFTPSRQQGTDHLNFVAGHCERLPIDSKKCSEFIGKLGGDGQGCYDTANGIAHDLPYFTVTYLGNRWFGPADMKPGLCEGGLFDGRFCAFNSDCRPLTVTDDMDKDAGTFCKKVTVGTNPASGKVGVNNNISYTCVNPSGSPLASDPDQDNNACTHGTGYYPKADLCGGSLNKSECLTGIRQLDADVTANDKKSFNLKTYLPPTDVSSGLHLPTYIAQQNSLPTADFSTDFSYVSYYAPRPPAIAAPDTSRQCASAGQCQIARVGAFSLDGITEGKVAYVGGQSINTIRFYGWAADNQMGLKDIWLDWGDGTVQEFHDSRMKNKKPFCGTSKECEFAPGLTCNTSNDCPPAAGRCKDTSFCTAKPNVACTDDRDCYETGMDVGDKCSPRLTFGNSDRGCEQNYFEFTHVALCPKEARNPTVMPVCGSMKFCSRDNTRKCEADSGCAKGDKCLAGLAPPGGCFDADNNACRFTPRLILKDNWGWCSGECRVQDLGGGMLGQGFDGKNTILLPYGGCYDSTGVMLNRDSAQSMLVYKGMGLDFGKSATNMCEPYPANDKKVAHYRPWIIFQGSLQLGVAP